LKPSKLGLTVPLLRLLLICKQNVAIHHANGLEVTSSSKDTKEDVNSVQKNKYRKFQVIVISTWWTISQNGVRLRKSRLPTNF
jgi:hypothetical protein